MTPWDLILWSGAVLIAAICFGLSATIFAVVYNGVRNIGRMQRAKSNTQHGVSEDHVRGAERID